MASDEDIPQVPKGINCGPRGRVALAQYVQACESRGVSLDAAFARWRAAQGFQNETQTAVVDILKLMGVSRHVVYAEVFEFVEARFTYALERCPPPLLEQLARRALPLLEVEPLRNSILSLLLKLDPLPNFVIDYLASIQGGKGIDVTFCKTMPVKILRHVWPRRPQWFHEYVGGLIHNRAPADVNGYPWLSDPGYRTKEPGLIESPLETIVGTDPVILRMTASVFFSFFHASADGKPGFGDTSLATLLVDTHCRASAKIRAIEYRRPSPPDPFVLLRSLSRNMESSLWIDRLSETVLDVSQIGIFCFSLLDYETLSSILKNYFDACLPHNRLLNDNADFFLGLITLASMVSLFEPKEPDKSLGTISVRQLVIKANDWRHQKNFKKSARIPEMNERMNMEVVSPFTRELASLFILDDQRTAERVKAIYSSLHAEYKNVITLACPIGIVFIKILIVGLFLCGLSQTDGLLLEYPLLEIEGFRRSWFNEWPLQMLLRGLVGFLTTPHHNIPTCLSTTQLTRLVLLLLKPPSDSEYVRDLASLVFQSHVIKHGIEEGVWNRFTRTFGFQ